MSQNNFSRRDFLKIGGLAAVSLPAVNLVRSTEKFDFLESEEAFGGFMIRKLRDDNPPYVVSDDYQRFDSQKCIFGRMNRDPIVQEILQSTKPIGTPDQPGWRREDVALNAASWIVSEYQGSNAPFTDNHGGLLSIDPIESSSVGMLNPVLREPWDYSGYTEHELANLIKKAAKFYGASLAGIAPLDERWVYSRYSDTFGPGGGEIVFTDVEEVILPEGQVSPTEAKQIIGETLTAMEPESLKELILETTAKIDPALLPDDAPPPAMMKAMPAKQYPTVIPQLLGSMPTPAIDIFAKELGLDLEVSLVDPGESALPRYLEDGSLAIPKTMERVIVLGFEMDYDGMDANPTPLGQASSGNGYSRGTFTAAHLAEFIRYLGFNAIPAVNQTALSVPQAIDAGLGELGRQGILITPKYGPRVRLAKVITDMPLAADKPISFGVKEFCDICGKCAKLCPAEAIYFEDQTMDAMNISTNPGVMKWPLDSEKCFRGWQMAGGDCGNCIRVCPFNKPEGWLHEATRILIGAKSGSLDKLLLNLDDASGYGEGDPSAEKFWSSDNFVHIKPD